MLLDKTKVCYASLPHFANEAWGPIYSSPSGGGIYTRSRSVAAVEAVKSRTGGRPGGQLGRPGGQSLPLDPPPIFIQRPLTRPQVGLRSVWRLHLCFFASHWIFLVFLP